MSTELRFRQIHLDFHTSELIERIGADFDPEEFAGTLERARVDSVTCFARCHHGYIYYDTERSPERRHPHLQRDLLREQIEACHARGIRVPIYVTVQWDHYTAERHPEWLCLGEDGRIQGTAPYEAGFYRKLCVNTPYVDWLREHVREILETLPVDGFFFDIVQPNDCSCRFCKEGMVAQGLDPSDGEARRGYGLEMVNRFKREMTAFVRRFSEESTIFYNAGHIGPRHRKVADAYTHWELESLPSGGWGYLHFPLTMRYARTLGIGCLGMTGKFHTTWGDFHSFKNPEALQFECFTMLALNARCSVGDQLHPEGKICRTTYELIGSVYSEVEKKEPWCKGATVLADIGVLSPEEFTGGSHTQLPRAAMGAVRMLQEGRQQFDVVDTQSDFSGYGVLVLPDEIPVSEELAAKIDRFLEDGGALIASHRSGLNENGDGFALKKLGVELKGEAPYSPDFVVPRGEVGRGLAETEHVIYERGIEVGLVDGAELLAGVTVPYFERDWRHFCSHNHTPSAGEEGYPGIVRKGRCIYFAHPIFGQYAQRAPRWCKQLFLNALEVLLPEPLVQVEGPSGITTALNEQAEEKRWVLHLLHYIPERRGQEFDVIEDVIPLYDLKISVRVEGDVKEVACAPEGEVLEFERKGGRVEFSLPRLEGHQMVVLNLA